MRIEEQLLEMRVFPHDFIVPGSSLPHRGGGWSGGGGVLSRCTGRGPACQKLPGGCCPMTFSRLLLRTSTCSSKLIWLICMFVLPLRSHNHDTHWLTDLCLHVFMLCDTVPDVTWLVSAWFHITTSMNHFVQITLDELRLVKQIFFYQTPTRHQQKQLHTCCC